jgi:hypothetical protein
MGAHAEAGPAFDSHELDQLQFDVQDVLLESIIDAVFRVARSAECVVGLRGFAGYQDFRDSTGLPYVLVYSFVDQRLVIQLEFDDDSVASNVIGARHGRP